MKSERTKLVYANEDLHAYRFPEILTALESTKYKLIRFLHCNLRDSDVEQLIKTIQQPNFKKNLKYLKCLDLRENHISESSIKKLLESTKDLPRLRYIDVRFNKTVDEEIAIPITVEKKMSPMDTEIIRVVEPSSPVLKQFKTLSTLGKMNFWKKPSESGSCNLAELIQENFMDKKLLIK